MSKTLLLADDSVTIQKVVGITFASEDVELVTVDNGDEALTRAREIRPDLVLADVSMPGLDGYELCQAIKADALIANTPVVLLTGTFEVQDASRATQVGADAQIAKPFEAQALVDLVRGLLERSQTPAPTPAASAPPAPAAAPSRPQGQVVAPPVVPEVVVPEVQAAPADVAREFDAEPHSQARTEPSFRPAPTDSGEHALTADTGTSGEIRDPGATDTDFSFSDLEFAKDATAGPAPDATQLMSSPPGPMAPAPPFAEPLEPATGMTEPRLPTSIQEDADSIPNLDVSEVVPIPDDDMALARTSVIDPSSAAGLLEDVDFEIPEEPISLSELEVEPPAPPQVSDDKTVLASEIASEMIDPPADVESLGERTMGGGEVYGELLASARRNLGTPGPDEQTEPESAPQPEPAPAPAPVVSSADSQAMRGEIEKLAWDAFGPMSEQLVREAVKKIEEIAWEVVPQIAEKLVREEIRRLTRDDD